MATSSSMEGKQLVDMEMGILDLLGVQRAMTKFPSYFLQATWNGKESAGLAGSPFREVIRGLRLDSSSILARVLEGKPDVPTATRVGMAIPGKKAETSAAGDNPEAPGMRRILVTDRDKAYHDGHQWRKYGGKKIKGSDPQKPREYYRCTHSKREGEEGCHQKKEEGCPALKQVQQIDSGAPPRYEVTYIGQHAKHPDPQFTVTDSSPRQPLSKRPCLPSNRFKNAEFVTEIEEAHSVLVLSPANNSSSDSSSVSPASALPNLTTPPLMLLPVDPIPHDYLMSDSYYCWSPGIGQFLEPESGHLLDGLFD